MVTAMVFALVYIQFTGIVYTSQAPRCRCLAISRCRLCSGRRLWWGGGSRLSWFDGSLFGESLLAELSFDCIRQVDLLEALIESICILSLIVGVPRVGLDLARDIQWFKNLAGRVLLYLPLLLRLC